MRNLAFRCPALYSLHIYSVRGCLCAWVNKGGFRIVFLIFQFLLDQNNHDLFFINLVQVGIYGYTAYSASKFGLKGLAEALQQEIIADNIHVSLIFPPDTETPGLLEGQNPTIDPSLFLKCKF